MKRIAVYLISAYQWTISPDHGMMRAFFPYGACRFYPTCSEYTKQSIECRGVLPGFLMGISQLLRCHPFHTSVKRKVQKVKPQLKAQSY